MDANGTRFKLLLGERDWGSCRLDDDTLLSERWARMPPPLDGAGWDPVRAELILQDLPWRFPGVPGAPRLDPSARRGAAVDRYGNWYWIDGPATGIRVLSSGSGRVTPLWPVPRRRRPASQTLSGFGPLAPAEPPSRLPLRGLVVTEDHYLVAGTLEPRGLLVFDLRTGGPPWQLSWPSGVPFAPLDLAARPDGGLLVISRDEDAARIWRLDRALRVEPAGAESPPAVAPAPDFEALDGTPRTATASGARPIGLDDAVVVPGDPVSIDLADDDLVVVLDRRNGTAPSVVRLLDRTLLGRVVELPGLDRPLVAHDLAVQRADAEAGTAARLFVVDAQGDQAYAFPLGHDGIGRVASQFLPLRRYAGRALVATRRGAFYDFGERWIPLVAQPRQRNVERAVVVTPVFDSELPGCVWHRLLLDGRLGPDARVTVSTAAADEERDLPGPRDVDDPRWQPEPAPYRRGTGPERPFADPSRDPRDGTYELLFQAARGRYLRICLRLEGTPQSSPRIRALRASFPRFSYLEHYVPAVYREDRGSAAFLEGFLANFEGMYTGIEDRIAAANVLFDPRTAPRDALDWLASWFDVVLDPGWDERRRRLFLEHAVDLFRWRGTARGMRMALGIALLACPDERLFADALDDEPGGIRIVERAQTKRVPAAFAGDPTGEALPRIRPGGRRWTPADGTPALEERWHDWLAQLASLGQVGAPPTTNEAFPVREPGGDRRPAWRTFASAVLGFLPAATDDDAARWRAYLRRRYQTVADLNRAHGRIGAAAVPSFDAVSLPAALPRDGAALADWHAFESVVLPGIAAAHRFSVLLPVPVGRAARGTVVRPTDVRDRVAEERRVARLVELEKPAHTTFDVKSYWLAFRVGEARLGRDTLLDYGSRSADLRPPAVLGSMHVGTSLLTSAMADVPERTPAFGDMGRPSGPRSREEGGST